MIGAPSGAMRSSPRSLDAAWEIARSEGLAGLAAPRPRRQDRDAAAFAVLGTSTSKRAIYDAMFVQGNQQLLARLNEQEWPDDPRAALRLGARFFVEFMLEDVQRYQLLFQRTIPNFEPAPRHTPLRCRCTSRCATIRVGRLRRTDGVRYLDRPGERTRTTDRQRSDRGSLVATDREVVDMYVDHVTATQHGRKGS